jgi:hypothetical protein
MSLQLRTALVAAVTLLVTPAAASAATGGPIPAPRPPQNPHMADNPFNNIHNDPWMTDTYRQAGPRPGNLETALGTYAPSLCGSLTFDERGRILSVCPSVGSAPTARLFDPETLAVMAELRLPNAPTPPGTAEFQNFAGGGYFFLDERGRIWSATKTNHLFVLRVAADGRSFRQVADYDLTSAVTGNERISSALPDFRGRIWFVTKANGKVGVLNTRTRRIRYVRTGEEIENSFTVDRDGIYIVSDKHMYRFSAGRNDRPRVDWKVRYDNSGIVKPGQVNAGSGTTPTILPRGYVAITDNADPMQVVVYRTAKKTRRRTVCEVPVFGKGASATENSLLGSGRSLIVENNYGYVSPFDTANAGKLTTPGFARIDINRNGRGCRIVWTNTEERGASVVPKLSTASQIIYTYTQDPGAAPGQEQWSWVGLNARTGKRVFKVPAATGVGGNNNYAGLAIGPDGTAYLGTIGGLRALRQAE